MKRYVLGFYFTHPPFHGGKVILIKKVKPDWQFGLLNGLGGSIEPGETMHQAMAREFEEECGIKTNANDWEYALTVVEPGKWELNALRIIGDELPVRSCDEGEVAYYHPPFPDNLEQTARWLLWMCADGSTFNSEKGKVHAAAKESV